MAGAPSQLTEAALWQPAAAGRISHPAPDRLQPERQLGRIHVASDHGLRPL